MSGSRGPRGLNLDLCAAIAERRLIEFDYNDVHRVAQPYCHGFTRGGGETVRAIEVGGGGRAFGKLWTVAKMRDVRVRGERFAADDPNYNPADSAMVEIHCRVER